MRLLRSLALTLCALTASSALAQSYSQGMPKPYDLLTRKSIFARDRVARSPYTPSTAPASAPRPPALPVFIGVVREDPGFIAVFEFPDSGRFVALHPGDAMPENKGTVLAITLDYIEYIPAPDQPATRLAVGRNIEGGDAMLPSSGSSFSSGSSPTTAPIEGDDIISRMRRRRQQEMNR